ncbi:MAG: DUF4376 domain-containing protein [Salinisphaera sp.]|nr:DUF4376 domain-containing protein [Salinisphaera sp.]
MTEEVVDEGTPWADSRRHQIAKRRYLEEGRGVTVGSQTYASDRDAQGLLTGSAVAAQQALAAGVAFSVGWKTADGWAQLDAKQLIDVANAVFAHVEACFAREAALLALVEDETYTDDLLGTGWPG